MPVPTKNSIGVETCGFLSFRCCAASPLHQFTAAIGSSTGCIARPEKFDLPIDYDSLAQANLQVLLDGLFVRK